MDARLAKIVSSIRRSNPPSDAASIELQEAVVNAGLKQELDESDLAEAAEQLGLDVGDFLEEMASWL